MRVLVTGSSGFVGRASTSRLAADGHEVVSLVRRPPRSEAELAWDPETGTIDPAALNDFDAVVHLAGENIAGGRWTTSRRERIRDSRVVGTRALAKAIAECESGPSVLLCASAVGFYGDRGDEVLDESSPPGESFLADVCREWEDAAAPARAAGIRVAHLRIGLVLGGNGGALPRMLTPFRLGFGGRLGSGRQWMSWITIDDLVAALRHALATDSLTGPMNAVSPHPVTNRDFTRALGCALSRPAILPVPAFGLRLALGKMADELLLASARVEPRALAKSGFTWSHPELEDALRHVLSHPGH